MSLPYKKYEKMTEYEVRYDLLNIAACICVVILHVNGSIWSFSKEMHWKVSLLIETLFYWAVPCFFMLSGATLIDYRSRYDTKTYLKKRFLKVGVPFLVWSLVSIPWAIFESNYLPAEKILGIRGIINVILNTEAMIIYWFFPALISAYLTIPVLSVIPKDKREKTYLYMIGYSFISYSIFPLLGNLLGLYVNELFANPLNGGGYIMFLLIGYYLTNYTITRKIRLILYCGGIVGWAVRFFYTLRESFMIDNIDKTMFNYSYFPSVLLSVAIFTFFWYYDWSFIKGRVLKLVRWLADKSFGVYLVHFYILRGLVDHLNIPMESYSWKFWGVIAVYILSVIAVSICKKIPIVKIIFP